MELSDNLQCLFSGSVEEHDDSYVVEVPRREIRLGDIQHGETYRIAILSHLSSAGSERADTNPDRTHSPPGPPVEEGERREVEITDMGEQGDGLTRVERGFVLIVPDTELGERVAVEITNVRENVAFAEVTERLSYYD